MRDLSKLAGAFGVMALAALAESARAGPVAPTPAISTVQVERGASGLRVKADNAPLEKVLDEIAKATSIEVAIQRGIERPAVNIDLRDVPVEEALRRILRHRNYALLYRTDEKGESKVDRVSVLNPTQPVATPIPRVRGRNPSAARRLRSGSS